MSPALWWIVGGLAACAAELALPGAMLLWVGLAALPVGVAAYWVPGLAIEVQFALFTALAVVGVVLARRWTTPPATATEAINGGAARLLGEIAIVNRPIVNGSGQIRLGDSVWAVRGPDAPEGARVRVTAVDGAILGVEPL